MMIRTRVVGVGSLLLLPLTGCFDPTLVSDTTTTAGGTGQESGTGPGMSASDGMVDESGGTQGCGNGVVDGGEECDDGGESAACNADCTAARCGDAQVNAAAGEACDDGAETATCNADCSAVSCGDGVVNATAGEECDEAGETATCDDDCTAVTCGDANSNEAAGEECDDGAETATCDVDCTAAMCGDGTFNMSAGEECDDTGRSPACDVDCTNVSCGDGVVNMNAGELCDGMGESPDCNSDCTPAMCGDGVVNMAASEECDTMGESMSCDGDCTFTACGDGLINVISGEQCDGMDLAGETCQTLGFGDGMLECGIGCTFDTSGCSSECPPFVAGSIDADLIASTPSLEQTRMSLAWDGASLWTSSGGGSGGIRLVESDAMGAFVGDYAPGLDLRSVFTQGDGTVPLYARVLGSPLIRVQMAPGVFVGDVTLVGGMLDSQASVAWHSAENRFIAQNSGTIDRWDPMGNYVDSVVLIGYGIGNESSYPQDRGVAYGAGCYLTIDDGTLSSWDPMGNRVDSITLNQATPGDFDQNFSVSFAGGRAWHGGNPDWHGYDVFGIAP